MKTILITGRTGTLAQELISQLVPLKYKIISPTHEELEITDTTKLESFVTKSMPDTIFHFAARTDLDWCEQHPEESYAINVKAVHDITKIAKKINTLIVFPSSYYVYEGLTKFPVDDRFDSPDITKISSIYSKQKLQAEYAISEIRHKKIFIIRFGSIFGGKNQDKKFVGKILRLAKNHSEISVVTDRFVQPSYSKDSIANMLLVVKTQQYGTYNLVGHGLASFYEYAQKIKQFASLKHLSLLPVTSHQFTENAPRSKKLQVINGKLHDLGLDHMRDWQIALKEYISELVL